MKTMLLLITAAMAAAGCQSSGGGVTLNNTVTACGSGDCARAPCGSLLDYGAGLGVLAREARALGYDSIAFEQT
ncbi:MAG: hypothetical protein GMKNLPBB_03382 [Myxococcota bacterium]|nr:hypothetical protein [Myxococcota bacterium]